MGLRDASASKNAPTGFLTISYSLIEQERPWCLYLDIPMLILDTSIHGIVVAGEGGKVGVHKPEDKAMEGVEKCDGRWK